MKHLTIRNVDGDLGKALRAEQRRAGISLNRTVLDLLRRVLGLVPGQPRDNGLTKMAGTWTQEDFADFEAHTALFEQVDKELWA